jgi:hypothetical protein
MLIQLSNYLENGSLQGGKAWAGVREFFQYFNSVQCHSILKRALFKTSPIPLRRYRELLDRIRRNPVY